MSKLEKLYDEIAYRKQEAYGMLLTFYDDKRINELCHQFKSTRPWEIITKFNEETFFATAALVSLQNLEDKLPPINGGYKLKDEDMANIVIDAMNAMICLVEAGWKPSEKYIVKGQQFTDGPKHRRLDALGKIMLNTIKEFKNKNGRLPKARELWRAIPEKDGCIQEKESLIDPEDPLANSAKDNKSKVIWWITPNGKEKETTFSRFQNRYTSIKRNFLS